MAGVHTMISQAMARPRPLAFCSSVWVIDALEHEGQLGPDLLLLVGREDVDDTVDRLRGRVGVQRGQGQVAGLGDGEAGRDGLQVAQFADQDHVGVLAEGILERVGEALGVGPDFALVDDAGLVPVDELDRVFHRDDVTLPLLVDLVDASPPAWSTCPSRWAR